MRGAWIEIESLFKLWPFGYVASREGGRGLKSLRLLFFLKMRPSPPVRGAWIEIFVSFLRFIVKPVASREGGVD